MITLSLEEAEVNALLSSLRNEILTIEKVIERPTSETLHHVATVGRDRLQALESKIRTQKEAQL